MGDGSGSPRDEAVALARWRMRFARRLADLAREQRPLRDHLDARPDRPGEGVAEPPRPGMARVRAARGAARRPSQTG